MSPDGKCFISLELLRINGSAIESIYGVLKLASGGNLSALSYGLSLLWNQLPNVWVDKFVNAICDGNALYNELYGDTLVVPCMPQLL